MCEKNKKGEGRSKLLSKTDMTEQEKLVELLGAGVTPYHTVEYCVKKLEEAGFTSLSYGEKWNLEKGKKYYVNHHGTSLFAFQTPEHFAETSNPAIRIAAAHTDYPCLRLKPSADVVTNAYAQVNVEVYGGPILNTWLDRPLGIAGRVAVRSKDLFAPKLCLYRSEKSLLTIPNLAIHMNREVNDGIKLNRQVDMLPIAGMLSEEQKTADYFLCFLAEELKVAKEDILDFELSIFCTEGPEYVGIKNDFLSSPRLDNLTSVSGLLSAIIEAEREDGINIIALFDHEEIGSRTKQGAGSLFFRQLLERILREIGREETIEADLYKSMMLSVDVAHALHPNQQGKMDITNKPVLGKGFCIKEACAQSYATDCESISIVQQICDKEKIAYQKFVNRSDMPGGGTLGAIAASILPIKTVDIGIPLLAMHSAREVMGSNDIDALKALVTAFFSNRG